MAGEKKSTTSPAADIPHTHAEPSVHDKKGTKPQADTKQPESPKAKLIQEVVDKLMKDMEGWSTEDQRQVLKEVNEKVTIGKVVPPTDHRANRQP